MSEPTLEPTTATEPLPPPAAKSGGRQQVVILAVVGVLVLVVVGIGAVLYTHRGPAKLTVTGGISVTAAAAFYQSQAVLDQATQPGAGKCPAEPTAADIPGSQIVITDASGKTVGVGTVGQPVWATQPRFVDSALSSGGSCLIPFTVRGVDASSKFYTIAVTGHGSVKFTKAEMSQPLALELH